MATTTENEERRALVERAFDANGAARRTGTPREYGGGTLPCVIAPLRSHGTVV